MRDCVANVGVSGVGEISSCGNDSNVLYKEAVKTDKFENCNKNSILIAILLCSTTTASSHRELLFSDMLSTRPLRPMSNSILLSRTLPSCFIHKSTNLHELLVARLTNVAHSSSNRFFRFSQLLVYASIYFIKLSRQLVFMGRQGIFLHNARHNWSRIRQRLDLKCTHRSLWSLHFSSRRRACCTSCGTFWTHFLLI